MNKIKVCILNGDALHTTEQMMVCAARLTQKGHEIQNMDDFIQLYNKPYKPETVKNMVALPHPTIQKFAVINVAVVGASRRFLAQITRHQNEVKFMSASLQYSDYSGKANFCVPYEILGTDQEAEYLEQCETAMQKYANLVAAGVDNDEAGYLAPQGLRNVLIISATLYQWKHMISQRVCRRNTKETRYVMLTIWQALTRCNEHISPGVYPEFFSDIGPSCCKGGCLERNMSCGKSMQNLSPEEILRTDFPKLCV